MLLSPAEFVIRKVGGLTKTANALGIPVTTVQGWKDRGTIPQKYWLPLMNVAQAMDEMIELSDFLNEHEAEDEESAA